GKRGTVAGVRGEWRDVYRAIAPGHGKTGVEDGGAAGGEGRGSSGRAGNARGARGRRCGGRVCARGRIPRAAESGGGRRREGHAARGTGSRIGSRVARRLVGGGERVWRRAAVHREISGAAAAYRDPGVRRPTRKPGVSRRT